MADKKKLEFYGGEWVSFLPFVVFLALIVVTTLMWGSISDGALWLPAFLALIIAFFFVKDKRHYAEVIIEGMASKEAITPVVCWLFAGVFSASCAPPAWLPPSRAWPPASAWGPPCSR